MSELQRLLMALLKRVLPQQHNSASGVVQAGRVRGNITVVNNHYAVVEPGPKASPEQKEVLRLLDGVPDRLAVLDFMEREFGTRMVIELKPHQVYRLRRYVETIHSNTKRRRA